MNTMQFGSDLTNEEQALVRFLYRAGAIPKADATAPAFQGLRWRCYLNSSVTPRGGFVGLNQQGMEAARQLREPRRAGRVPTATGFAAYAGLWLVSLWAIHAVNLTQFEGSVPPLLGIAALASCFGALLLNPLALAVGLLLDAGKSRAPERAGRPPSRPPGIEPG